MPAVAGCDGGEASPLVKIPGEGTPHATMLDDIKKTLWLTADKLRANMDAAEYKHLVLGLIFVKYISDTFAARRAELTARLTNPDDAYYYGNAAPEDLASELEDRDYYKEVNVFWVPEAARWESMRAAAKQPDIGKRIDDALTLIEAENPTLKNILDKRYARSQLPDGKLGELVDLVSTIGFGDTPDMARDTLGQVYEYFLGMFASAEGKRGGQFYTPASIVKTLVSILSPHSGKVYDPCCGSGGMFVQSEKFIEAHGGRLGDVSIYGQESNPTTWRLAAMNLAIRGIDFNLGREPGDTHWLPRAGPSAIGHQPRLHRHAARWFVAAFVPVVLVSSKHGKHQGQGQRLNFHGDQQESIPAHSSVGAVPESRKSFYRCCERIV